MKRKILGVLNLAIIMSFISVLAIHQVFAGFVKNNFVNDDLLLEEEIPYADWRYDRMSEDMGLYPAEYQMFSLKGIKNLYPVELKNTIISENAAVFEIDAEQIDLSESGTGINFVFGNCREGDGSAIDSVLAQKREDGINSRIFGLSFNGNKYNFSSFAPNETGNDFAWENMIEAEFDLRPSESKGKIENATLRFVWTADGNVEFSIRDLGASVSEREAVYTSSGFGTMPKGFVTLTMTGMKIRADLVGNRTYALSPEEGVLADPGAEDMICGFDQEAENFLGTVRVVSASNAESLFIGATKTIRFFKTADNDATLVNRNAVKVSASVPESLLVSFKLKINEVSGSKRFGFNFGMEKINAEMKEAGTFLSFGKTADGYDCLIETLDETLEHKTIDGNIVEVAMIVRADGSMSVKVNGWDFYNGEAGKVCAEGYFGFGVSGNITDSSNFIDVEIQSVSIENNYNDRPENSNIVTKFNGNEYNRNDWFMRNVPGVTNGSLYVKNNSLIIDGAGDGATFATRNIYSNFEVRFDIFDSKNDVVYDSEGNIVRGASDSLAFAFGQEFGSVESGGYPDEALFQGGVLYFGGDRNIETGERQGKTQVAFAYKNVWSSPVVVPDSCDYSAVGYSGGKVSFRIRMEDAVLTVSCRQSESDEWTELFCYKFENGSTPRGQLYFMCKGNNNVQNRPYEFATFVTLDNIVVTNLDEDANLVKPPYSSSIPLYVEDYVYEDSWTEDYLLESTVTEGSPYGDFFETGK